MISLFISLIYVHINNYVLMIFILKILDFHLSEVYVIDLVLLALLMFPESAVGNMRFLSKLVAVVQLLSCI